jgi:hypothetical protein
MEYRRGRIRLVPEALLDVVDAGLEGGDLLLELGEVAGQDLAPAALVGK